MLNYLNNILTLILWLDFLQRRFPKEVRKIEKLGSNIYIIIYSYFEVQMKKNGIDIFCEPQIEKVSILDQNEDKNEYKEIWHLLNKHRALEKEKFS